MIRHVCRAVLCAASFVPAIQSLSAQATPSVPVATQFDSLHFRSIGPAIMSGRIADLAVYEKNTSIWYVGAAHGGVWKTTSNGAVLTPIFEDHGLMSIGDVTVSATALQASAGTPGWSPTPTTIAWCPAASAWRTAACSDVA
jgi:hypothetical protein